MGNILQAQVQVSGIRPLLFHRFGPDSLPLEKQEQEGVAGNSPNEWRKTALATKDGQLYVPPTYVFGCVRNGAKYTKKGRSSIQATVASTLQVGPQRILLDRYFLGFPNGHEFDIATVDTPSQDEEQPVYLDITGVRNPTTKSRNIRYRIAASTGWTCSFDLLWDKTVVSRSEMEACTRDAGRFYGLGDGRSVGFGRFEVTQFQVSQEA